MDDDYYDSEQDRYQGDQSWQFFRAQDVDFYESEFQPEPPKRKKQSGIRSKIQSLRKSFFNQESSLGSSLENTPKVVRRESKGLKGKLESWRRSWFGPESSPNPSHRLSVSQTLHGSKEEPVLRRDRNSSRNSVHRQSATRSFIEKHAQIDEENRKKSRPAMWDEVGHIPEISAQGNSQSHSGRTQVMVSRSPSNDIEEEISECKIQNRNEEREFLTKIKEMGSLDYDSDSDEDVTRLSHALRSPQMNSIVGHENGVKQRDIKQKLNELSEEDEEVMEEGKFIHETRGQPEKPERKDVDPPVDEKKLEEGLALFNVDNVSEDESPTQRRNAVKEEYSRITHPPRDGRDLEANDIKSNVSEEECEEEREEESEEVYKPRKPSAKSGISFSSNASPRLRPAGNRDLEENDIKSNVNEEENEEEQEEESKPRKTSAKSGMSLSSNTSPRVRPAGNGKDLEENDIKSNVNEEDNEEEQEEESKPRRTSAKSGISFASNSNRRSGATIQISSKGRT